MEIEQPLPMRSEFERYNQRNIAKTANISPRFGLLSLGWVNLARRKHRDYLEEDLRDGATLSKQWKFPSIFPNPPPSPPPVSSKDSIMRQIGSIWRNRYSEEDYRLGNRFRPDS